LDIRDIRADASKTGMRQPFVAYVRDLMGFCPSKIELTGRRPARTDNSAELSLGIGRDVDTQNFQAAVGSFTGTDRFSQNASWRI